MLNENAKKWVEAPRSGKYAQGVGQLRKGTRYCCLGVACDLYGGTWQKPGADAHYFDLPSPVKKWLGLASSDGSYGHRCGYRTSLLMDNDVQGRTFAEIADIIESEPKGLFAAVGK